MAVLDTGFLGSLPLAQAVFAPVLGPFLIIVLCVVAGIGTFLLLPSRREAATRKIGGAIALLALLVFGAILFRWAVGSAEAAPQAPTLNAYFWIFAAITVIGALRVVTHPQPVYSALYFVLTIFSSAGLFVLLAAEFMAAALVLIYAGAILVTYVFVIMLAQQTQSPGDRPLAGLADYDVQAREPLAACVVGFLLMGMLLFVLFDRAGAIEQQVAPGAPFDARSLGETLFSRDLVTVEVAGVILTLAMVGAIVIARRRVPVSETDRLRSAEPPPVIPDNPKTIPIYGTENPRQKAYPET